MHPMSTECAPGMFGDECSWDATCLQAVVGSLRQACGYTGIKKWKCKKLGCCFDKSIKGVNWCFDHLDVNDLAPIMETNSAACEYGMLDPASREPCDYSNYIRASEGRCRALNCCYHVKNGFAWCFKPHE